ncbi:MAG: PD-(D/E)XK nuclease family protein, partial [Erysipelotrichaceae bacterium]|nr:PD-(D/E)XK nuclease family protein [Erysipelotrichaceae bacterium]
FINTYATVRKTGNSLLMQLDNSARLSIYRELAAIRNAGFGENIKEVIPSVMSMNVCNQISESGKIHITDFKGALNTVRDNLYIVGFSATNYPGAPKENYLLLDDDFRQFENTDMLTSEGEVNKRKDTFWSLLQTYSNQNSKIHISYAGYNASELKKDNPSSLMFEIYRKEHGDNATLEDMREDIHNIGYFAPDISVTREIGKAFLSGNEIVPSNKQEEVAEDIVKGSLEQEYSPSALEKFFECPQKFLFKYVLGIPEPEEDKLFEIVPAIELGNIAHTMMEIRSSEESAEKFLEVAGKYFDTYVKQHRPVVADKVDIEKNRFLDMMKNGFDMETENSIVETKEVEIQCTHEETGIRLHGYPDRVELNGSSNKRTIVDYKTGATVKHVENDLDTCLQGILYAYMLERNGKPVDHVEYRYIRMGKTVCCNYDEAVKERLTEKLNTFRNALESGEYSFATDDGVCKYCKYKDICGIQKGDGQDDE